MPTTIPTIAPSPTAIPTLPICSTGGILYLESDYLDKDRQQWHQNLHWVCSDGSHTQKIATGFFGGVLAVSPSGNYIAYGEESVLKVMDLSSREITTYLESASEEQIYAPTWSPDEEYIAYEKFRATVSSSPHSPIEVMHFPTGTVSETFIPNEYQVQLLSDDVDSVTWLPNGDQILLFTRYSHSIHLADVVCDDVTHLCAASNIRKIPTSTNLSVQEPPAVSPDGTMIAAACLIFESEAKPADPTLCILDFYGNVIRQFKLKDLGVDYAYGLSWSPDGSRIAFDDTGQIYVLSLTDQSLIRLVDTGYGPVWLP